MIQTQTFRGLPGGMDQQAPPHEVEVGFATYMRDILLHRPGLISRRGPVSKVASSATVAYRASGIAAVQTYGGTYRVAVLAGDVSQAKIHFYAADLQSVTATKDIYGTMPTSPRRAVAVASALGGGTLIGYSSGYRASLTAETGLLLWKGANKADYTNTAGTTTRGSTAVSCTSGFTANVEAGMFVFTSSAMTTLVGVVASVDSDTGLTLEDPALISVAATNLFFTAVRGLAPRAASGTVTTATTSAVVNGQNSRFQKEGLASGTWDLYRAFDLTYVGTVTSVQSDAKVTLTASAAVEMVKEKYLAIKRGSGQDYSINVSPTGVPNRKLGFLTATYAGRQFYANRTKPSATQDYTTRVWYSDTQDPEAVNVARDGTWFNVQSSGSANTPILQIVATTNGLAIFKENELWVLVGSDESSFALRKAADLGLLHTNAVQPYSGGVVFAARDGIYYFDGVRLENLTARLGLNYHQAVKGWTNGTDQARSMAIRDHFMVYLSKYADPVGVTKNGSTTSPTAITICINLRTGALTYLSNLEIWGSIRMPSGSGYETLYVVNTSGPVTSICDANALFDSTGADAITSENSSAGPSLYLETGRYDLGDPERKKLYKQLAMQYISNGGTLTLETIPGLNSTGTGSGSTYPSQATYANKRIKFLKRTTHLGFRLYQTDSSPTDIKIGPWALGFKPQRVGRI